MWILPRRRANNRDWLSFRRCSAWSVIFSFFVRRPEDPPERWSAISFMVGPLRRPSYTFPLLLHRFFSLLSKRGYNPTIHISQRHTIASVTLRGQYLIKCGAKCFWACGLLYIKIFPEFCSPYRRPSVADERLHKTVLRLSWSKRSHMFRIVMLSRIWSAEYRRNSSRALC